MRPWITALSLLLCLVACRRADQPIEPSALPMVREVVGSGPAAHKGNLVTISYRVELPDGRELLQGKGYKFIIGSGSVIDCVEEAVTGMKVKGERVVLCPPNRHWGRRGYGDGAVPPGATLTMSVRLAPMARRIPLAQPLCGQ